jgi:transposase-like protein
MTNASRAIADLRSRWCTLHDLDRAQAIKSIHQSGVSLRELAPLLNCSPSLLTHLLQAAQASIEDRVLARQGILSTRTLVRRAKAVGTLRTALHREAVAFERNREAFQGCKSILNWLAEQKVARDLWGWGIEMALLHLSLTDQTWQLPPDTVPKAVPGDEIFFRRWAVQPESADLDPVTGVALRLAQWVSLGISNVRVRQRALELASEELDQR